MTALTYPDAIVLGVVEGLTEFLPVSSTGHLTIAEKVLGLTVDDPAVTAFTAIIQFGAIVATFLFFRADIARLAVAWVRGLMSYRRTGIARTGDDIGGVDAGAVTTGGAPGEDGEIPQARRNPDYLFAWFVIAGSTPIVIIAVLAKPLITGPLRSLWVVAVALILWSAVMWWAERNPTQRLGEEELSLRQVLTIGLMQCVALVPGVSRSGATISGGLLVGATRVAATRLSFFLAIPALTGAGLYSLKDVDTSVVGWGQLAVGTLVSFVVAYASIAWLLKLVAGHAITIFNPYRIAVGVSLIALLSSSTMTAT
jgi:undecaprenyl-diphosphatase